MPALLLIAHAAGGRKAAQQLARSSSLHAAALPAASPAVQREEEREKEEEVLRCSLQHPVLVVNGISVVISVEAVMRVESSSLLGFLVQEKTTS
jgi:hypothetical protein